MALQQVTGQPPEVIENEYREDFQSKSESEWYDFEERYCLFSIPHQPEDYDGPERYCVARCSYHHEETDTWRCKAHKGQGVGHKETLREGNPKHYMYATDEYLMDNLTDAEQELYQNILSWAEVYGISEEEDPASYDDLKLLAKQRVREVKASKYIFEKDEMVEKFIRDEEGNVVLDDDGNPKTEDDINPASEEYRRLVNLIKGLKKELGITRREQLKADDRSQASDAADRTSEAMSELVSDDEKNYNPDDYK